MNATQFEQGKELARKSLKNYEPTPDKTDHSFLMNRGGIRPNYKMEHEGQIIEFPSVLDFERTKFKQDGQLYPVYFCIRDNAVSFFSASALLPQHYNTVTSNFEVMPHAAEFAKKMGVSINDENFNYLMMLALQGKTIKVTGFVPQKIKNNGIISERTTATWELV